MVSSHMNNLLNHLQTSHYCSLFEDSLDEGDMDQVAGASGAFHNLSKIWNRDILRVYFENKVVLELEGWKHGGELMSSQLILSWAKGAWNVPRVPTFEETNVKERSDIRVWFTGITNVDLLFEYALLHVISIQS